MSRSRSFHPDTLAVRTQVERAQREHAVPVYLTSSFVFDDAEQARAMFADEVPGNIYTRFSNPNANEFVDKMCHLEGAEDGIATASGMSAVFTSIAGLLQSGDHIVASRSVFGSTHQIFTKLFPRWQISHTYVDGNEREEWEKAIQPNTKMIFVESPSNPGLHILDLAMLGGLCKERGLIFNVDNCFATPVLQQPMRFGADVVIHSATKFIDGQGRGIGGIVVGRKDLIKELRFFARHTGPAMSPFNAWMFSKSLETLSIRMERHSRSAQWLAEQLEAHKAVASVRYPFLASHPQADLARKQMSMGGGLVVFTLKGGKEAALRLVNQLEMVSVTANLGDSRTIVTHPASTTHSKLTPAEREAVGISDGLLRVSVGLEHPDDILWDLMKGCA